MISMGICSGVWAPAAFSMRSKPSIKSTRVDACLLYTSWPELLNRRKATAAVLPLYNAAGMPYWYVETQRMVHASERLCEAAMAQADGFDPYRAQMTSAMTEEMFFTSFVEGAQIPLQEAMDFLQRGTEPENIQEQMIWNNRCAWQAMISALYLPLDEPFVRALAWALTQEMDLSLIHI